MEVQQVDMKMVAADVELEEKEERGGEGGGGGGYVFAVGRPCGSVRGGDYAVRYEKAPRATQRQTLTANL